MPASRRGRLTILDLCTGTGCIALQLYSLLRSSFPDLRVLGLDVSPEAVALAWRNVEHNIRSGHMAAPRVPHQTLQFRLGDMFSSDWEEAAGLTASDGDGNGNANGNGDLVITCNPPYISRDGFAHDTTRSVRLFEPKLAQVPPPRLEYRSCRPEDVFYARLLDIASSLRPRAILCEVGGWEQASRVVQMAMDHSSSRDAEIEIWADSPDVRTGDSEPSFVQIGGKQVTVRGSGLGRSVFIYR